MARLSRRLWGGTSLKTAAKEANSCRKQPKKLACKPGEENFPTIQYEKQTFLVCLMLASQKISQLSGHKILQSLSSYKSASLAHQRQMSDTLRQQIPPPNSSAHEPFFPVNQGSSSFQCSVSNQSLFSVQAMPHHSFFASATIGSISNCVLNIVHPRDPAGSCEENVAKRPKLDGSS